MKTGEVLIPTSLEELREQLTGLREAKRPILPSGGREPLRSPGDEDCVTLSFAKLNRILDHDAADLTGDGAAGHRRR